MFYVINTHAGFVEHESRSEDECKEYVRNVGSLFGKYQFRIVKGATEREMALRPLRNSPTGRSPKKYR